MTSTKNDSKGYGTTRLGDILQLVSFNIGVEEYGVDILKVREINRLVEVTKLPKAPSFIEGVINLRGRVIPIINLRKRFGMPEKQNDKHTRVIVVELSNATIGFIVDAVREVLRLPVSVTENPPSMMAGKGNKYVSGVGKLEDRLLILLDLEKVLSDGDIVSMTKAA